MRAGLDTTCDGDRSGRDRTGAACKDPDGAEEIYKVDNSNRLLKSFVRAQYELNRFPGQAAGMDRVLDQQNGKAAVPPVETAGPRVAASTGPVTWTAAAAALSLGACGGGSGSGDPAAPATAAGAAGPAGSAELAAGLPDSVARAAAPVRRTDSDRRQSA